MSLRQFAKPLFASTVIAFMPVFGSHAASAATTDVSGAISPLSPCTADAVASQPGTNYGNAEVEPWVDVNPANPNNLIAVWQQDRWSNGGSRGLAGGVSFDGGATWTTTIPQGITKCTGGDFDRASDPWITFAPNGDAYFMSLAFMNDEPSGAGGDNAMMVSKSTNGGASWGPPKTLILDTDGQLFNDKNAMTADPYNSNFVYASWDKLIDYTLPHGKKKVGVEDAGGGSAEPPGHNGGDGVADARERVKALRTQGPTINKATIYTGPTIFVRTTNGGTSWEAPKVIYQPGSNAQTINNLIEVLPSGLVMNFYTHILNNGAVKFGFVKSGDKGATWSSPVDAFTMVTTNDGTVTPDAKEPVRDANILFDVAVDRDTGNIYVVWQDGRQGNIDRVFFSMSTTAGNSWSPAIRISATPASKNKLREQAFVPSVAVGKNGKVHVTYYDFRNDTADAGLEAVDYFAISCNAGAGANCRKASGWGNEVRLTGSSFNMLDAPVARGHFLGDYQGLVLQGDAGMRAVFGIASAPNVSDIVTALIAD